MLQSRAGAADDRRRAQGSLAKEVLLRQARAQPARRQGGRLCRQAFNAVTLGQGWEHGSLWPPAQAVEDKLKGKNEARVTCSFSCRCLALHGVRLLDTFPRAGRW